MHSCEVHPLSVHFFYQSYHWIMNPLNIFECHSRKIHRRRNRLFLLPFSSFCSGLGLEVHRVQTTFLKEFLSLVAHTSGYAIRLKIGATHLAYDTLKESLPWKEKVLAMPEYRILRVWLNKIRAMPTLGTACPEYNCLLQARGLCLCRSRKSLICTWPIAKS